MLQKTLIPSGVKELDNLRVVRKMVLTASFKFQGITTPILSIKRAFPNWHAIKICNCFQELFKQSSGVKVSK